MIEFMWEFVIKEKVGAQFELLFGPGGAWSKLFAQSPGFKGTTLLRDTKNPQRYLVIDLWETESMREQALIANQAEYASLETTLADWAASQTEMGTFKLRAEATVRPRGKTRHIRGESIHRRNRRITR